VCIDMVYLLLASWRVRLPGEGLVEKSDEEGSQRGNTGYKMSTVHRYVVDPVLLCSRQVSCRKERQRGASAAMPGGQRV